MSTAVVMPQMGESIAEGTIVRWIKKVGETVDRDEPLFEISTDKVDAEIPSPAAGVLTEIRAQEGETVPVNSVVATIGEAGAVAGAATPTATPSTPEATNAAKARRSAQPQPDGAPARSSAPAPQPPAAVRDVFDNSRPTSGVQARAGRPEPADDPQRHRSSPLVRKIAKEHNVDVSQIHGSGAGGRVTKHDILEYLDHASDADAGSAATSTPDAEAVPPSGDRVEIKPLSIMRRKIAEHMVLSRRTSAHVHSVFHVNFATVDRIRTAKKKDYESRGVKLTYMAFIAKAVVDALRLHPMINASLDGTNIVFKKDINLGIAVALEGGLIVPVIKNADEKNMLGLSRAIADVADRARAKQLKPEEVHDGTFTITNPGQFGAQFGMPIINQPQVAILGVGTIEKRPVVIDDAIGIRPMAYLTLGYDHRLIDGATADQFMADVTERLERFDDTQV
jgi:2-oxoglutarate dehydrogenase E2 component (dihydrolipoamide succinyltransferase)